MIAPILFFCAFIVFCDFYNYIFIVIFIVIVPGVNRPLDYFLTILIVYLTVSVFFLLQLKIARYKLYIALHYLFNYNLLLFI